ncbi:hypothetical protein PGT21_015800 [Puccinia graminis f. sp. tritici]|uniref:Uncharacterized protein n=1 Tax=Puccinia graminis f. sp. tritici TaxID=56615 RepID=A0A5B0LXH5_PUCGR|nr:hypothetical protein PGT21_015800 [Puccinia graminis f. sp. tritici]KAA1075661.1 hypothetical protein PGTUg99_034010 [Puccinia graminis f. sp. tritici]
MARFLALFPQKFVPLLILIGNSFAAMMMFKKPFLRSPAQALVLDHSEKFLEVNRPVNQVEELSSQDPGLQKVEEISFESKNPKGVVSFKQANFFPKIKENTGSDHAGHGPEIRKNTNNDRTEKNSRRQLLAHATFCVDTESKAKMSDFDPVTENCQSSKIKLMDENINKLNLEWIFNLPTF